MVKWISRGEFERHLENTFGIEPEKLGYYRHIAGRRIAGRPSVRVRAGMKDGKPLARPKEVPPEVWDRPDFKLLDSDSIEGWSKLEYHGDDALKWQPPGRSASPADDPAPAAREKRPGSGRPRTYPREDFFAPLLAQLFHDLVRDKRIAASDVTMVERFIRRRLPPTSNKKLAKHLALRLQDQGWKETDIPDEGTLEAWLGDWMRVLRDEWR